MPKAQPKVTRKNIGIGIGGTQQPWQQQLWLTDYKIKTSTATATTITTATTTAVRP